MQIGIQTGTVNEDWDKTMAFVVEAERLGADMVWSAENWGHDAMTPLAFMAGQTSRIKLATGIAQVPARTPAMLAMTAMSLQAMSKGRFVLGLGTSGPQVVEGWHGVPFANSVTRMKEAAEVVRMVSSGARLSYKGKVYELPLPGGEGKALRSSAQARAVPVYFASLGKLSLEWCGEMCDGWTGAAFMPDHADIFLQHLETGAKRSGRTLKDLELVAPAGRVDITDDVERATATAKKSVGFMLGAMGSRQHNFYNEATARAGYADVTKEIQRLWLDHKEEEALKILPDEIVQKMHLIGTEEMVRERVRVHIRAGMTQLKVDPTGRNLEQRLENLAKLIQICKEEEGQMLRSS